jgi:hypothetical protein
MKISSAFLSLVSLTTVSTVTNAFAFAPHRAQQPLAINIHTLASSRTVESPFTSSHNNANFFSTTARKASDSTDYPVDGVSAGTGTSTGYSMSYLSSFHLHLQYPHLILMNIFILPSVARTVM